MTMVLHGGCRNPLKNILWLQWAVSTGAMFMLLTLGLTIGWTSPYLAKLTAEDSPLPVTTGEASWVASFLNLGRFLGAILGGISVYCIDTKQTLVLLGFPLMLGNVCIILANSVTWLYVARVAAGLSVGMAFSSFPTFLGEISSPKLRGTLVSLAMSGVAFGTLIGNIMGAYLSMAVFSCIAMVPNVAFILFFLWVPQSPHYLVRAGRMADAEGSIARYDPNLDSKVALESLKEFIAASESVTFKDRLREFNVPRNRKAGLITLALYFFMQFSGLNTLYFYMEIIFTNAQVSVIAPATLVIIIGGVGVVSGWVAVYIADKFERKMLFMATGLGTAVSTSALAIHFNLLDSGFDPNMFQWLPIASMVSAIFFICSGITTVPNMILSELFAPNIKNLAACFASIALGIFAFIAVKTYQPLVDTIGNAYVFWGQAILMVISIIFSAIFVPKTKGKSLQDIQDASMQK